MVLSNARAAELAIFARKKSVTADIAAGVAAAAVAAGVADDAAIAAAEVAANTPNLIADVGATTELSTAKYQEAVLTENGTLTFPAVTEAWESYVRVSGAFTLAWGAEAVYDADTEPTYADPSMYHLVSTDGAGAEVLVLLVASGIGDDAP